MSKGKTGNEEEIERIKAMNVYELLDYIIAYPDNLIDPYYAMFGTAVRKRHAELAQRHELQT